VQEWRASGESRDAFAAKHGLKSKLLGWWASQLAREARRPAKAKATTPSVVFARVASTPAPLLSAPSPSSLEIALPRGCVIRVAAGFDAKLLVAVVAALEVR
jgi:hypothetical protein